MGARDALPSAAPRWEAPADAGPLARIGWMEELGDRGAVDPLVRDFIERSSVKLASGGVVDPCERVLRTMHGLATMCAPVPEQSGDPYQTARCTLETLVADCKAMVVVGLAMGRALGLGARVVWLRLPPRVARFDHATMQLRRARDAPWLWCDPWFVGAQLGEHPFAAADRLSHLEVSSP